MLERESHEHMLHASAWDVIRLFFRLLCDKREMINYGDLVASGWNVAFVVESSKNEIGAGLKVETSMGSNPRVLSRIHGKFDIEIFLTHLMLQLNFFLAQS